MSSTSLNASPFFKKEFSRYLKRFTFKSLTPSISWTKTDYDGAAAGAAWAAIQSEPRRSNGVCSDYRMPDL
jgi:hypothetical protein